MEEETVEAATDSVNTIEGRTERLEKLAKNHILASMGVGLIPIPLVDLVALMGIQLDMIKKLSAEYDVPFKKEIGKSILSSLLGGFLPAAMGGAIASLIKFVPLIGQTTGAVTMPVISGAATYAVYKVFVQHFESGGTFLDLDPAKVKSYFSEQFAKGKKVVSELKPEEAKKAST
ncbi:MAG: DUF697 domain-containing protein [Desulfuromonadaceae bacterium]|nr:DUF697 domain-containing protein [Desulfuromonadaceae bacterium]